MAESGGHVQQPRRDSLKQICERELARKACVKLRARELPEFWAKVEATVARKFTYRVEPILSLMELYKSSIPEFRRPQSMG